MARKGKVVTYKSAKDGQWYWKAIATNGKTVATGSEGYKTKQGCANGFKSLSTMLKVGSYVEIEEGAQG